MATRATYQINSTCFYCHWDGYPTGAAHRFAMMVAALTVAEADSYRLMEDRRGGFEYAFIRGVLDAEPTDGHDAHGDTEYRYTLKATEGESSMIHVQERGDGDFRRGFAWRTLFRGELVDWLNEMRAQEERQIADYAKRAPDQCKGVDPKAAALENIPIVVRVIERRDYAATDWVSYATAAEAAKIGEALAAYSARFKDDNPNKADYAKKAEAWRAAA